MTTLKIDRSFTAEVGYSGPRSARALIHSIIDLGRGNGVVTGLESLFLGRTVRGAQLRAARQVSLDCILETIGSEGAPLLQIRAQFEYVVRVKHVIEQRRVGRRPRVMIEEQLQRRSGPARIGRPSNKSRSWSESAL